MIVVIVIIAVAIASAHTNSIHHGILASRDTVALLKTWTTTKATKRAREKCVRKTKSIVKCVHIAHACANRGIYSPVCSITKERKWNESNVCARFGEWEREERRKKSYSWDIYYRQAPNRYQFSIVCFKNIIKMLKSFTFICMWKQKQIEKKNTKRREENGRDQNSAISGQCNTKPCWWWWWWWWPNIEIFHSICFTYRMYTYLYACWVCILFVLLSMQWQIFAWKLEKVLRKRKTKRNRTQLQLAITIDRQCKNCEQTQEKYWNGYANFEFVTGT